MDLVINILFTFFINAAYQNYNIDLRNFKLTIREEGLGEGALFYGP